MELKPAELIFVAGELTMFAMFLVGIPAWTAFCLDLFALTVGRKAWPRGFSARVVRVAVAIACSALAVGAQLVIAGLVSNMPMREWLPQSAGMLPYSVVASLLGSAFASYFSAKMQTAERDDFRAQLRA